MNAQQLYVKMLNNNHLSIYVNTYGTSKVAMSDGEIGVLKQLLD